MKLTIETTTDAYNKKGYGAKVSVETFDDGIAIDELIYKIKMLLVAYGFSEKQVDKYFIKEEK